MIIPAGFAHIVHLFAGDAIPTGASVTYGIDTNGVGDPNLIASLCHGAMADTFVELMGPSTSLNETLIHVGPSPDGPVGNYAEVVVAGNTGAQVTPQVAVLVRKRSLLGGRKNRGRFYLPGLIEGGVNEGGLLSEATYTAWQSAASAFLTALDTAGHAMVILHNAVGAPTPVSALVLDTKVATQRRRLRR
jgi:hypothetical protein